MRIHSNVLSDNDFTNAVAGVAWVDVVGVTVHGSRSRNRAFEFSLSGSGNYGGQWGAQDHKSATWDEWGIVLNALFTIDPNAVVPRVYDSAEHFRWVTGDRYRGLSVSDQHLRHKWHSGDVNGWSAAGTYYVQSCTCGAILRRMAPGRQFSELSAV